MDILLAIAIMALGAVVLGAALGFASIKFKVEGDPLVDQIDAILPQTQCGQCGFAGCRPYAEAMAAGALHNLLFANRRHLGTTSLKMYAKEAGVANKKFLVEMMDSVYGWQVRNDLLQGVEIGVRDVPTFYINDVLYTGRITVAELGKAIDDALRGSAKKKTAQRA